MEVREVVIIVSSLILAGGWFLTGYLNMLKDVAQKRLDYRLKTLEVFLPVCFHVRNNTVSFSQPEFIANLEDARTKFQIYGLNDEIDLMEQFINEIEKQDVAGANDVLKKLVPLMHLRIRKDLKLNTK
jgi:hypothetical protein